MASALFVMTDLEQKKHLRRYEWILLKSLRLYEWILKVLSVFVNVAGLSL